MDRIDTIRRVCDALSNNNFDNAKHTSHSEWPFEPVAKPKRKMSPRQLMAIWMRDGFIDRYSGQHLIFPGALRLLAHLLPEEFPYHRNGRSDCCHMVHWEFYPSHDHVVPLARGGLDVPSNIVTTSMLRNQIKANWLLEELGWELRPAGNAEAWDGLTGWFLKEYEKRAVSVASEPSLKKWRSLAIVSANA